MYSVTAAFVEWLTNLGFDASTYPPEDGEQFVTVNREGGGASNLVDHPTITIQTWAATEVLAEAMALLIRNEALTSTLPYGVTRASVNAGPYKYYDEDTRMPRFQLVLDVTCQLV